MQEQNASRSVTQAHRVGKVTLRLDPAKSPNWYMDYSLDGKQYRPSTRTSSLKQARKIAHLKDAQLVLGQARPPEKNKLRLFDVSDAYIKSLERQGKSQETTRKYRQNLRQFAYFARANGVTRLDQISAELLEKCQDQLLLDSLNGCIPEQERRGRKLPKNSVGTVRDKLKVVRQLIRFALRRKLLREDPTPGYQLIPDEQREAICWDREQLASILLRVEDRFSDALHFLPLTGLRSSELCWLTKDEVVLKGKPYIRIRAKRCPITGRQWWPKKRKNRIVPLCSKAVAIIKRAMAASPGPWVFWDRMGKATTSCPEGRFAPRRLLQGLKRAMKIAGVGRGVIHTFRHVFCSFMANKRIAPLKVMKILGHGSLDILLIYYHLSDDELLGSLDDVDFADLVGDDPGKEVI